MDGCCIYECCNPHDNWVRRFPSFYEHGEVFCYHARDTCVLFCYPGCKNLIYLSASEVQTKLNITHVRRSIEKGWKSGGYHWYDLNPEGYDAREKRRPRYEGKVFRILEDGTRDEYTSSGEAKRILKIGHIPRAIKTGMKAGGYNWYDVI